MKYSQSHAGIAVEETAFRCRGCVVMVTRILYDHQIFSLQSYGGISRYYAELAYRYRDDPDLSIELGLRYSGNHYLKETQYADLYQDSDAPSSRLFAAGMRYARVDLRYLLNRRVSVRALERQEFDIFHPTYYDPYFLEHLGKKPYYLIVHDMIQELFPQFYPENPANNEIRSWKKTLSGSADQIVTVSESTKRDLCRLHGVDSSLVKVIHQGISIRPPKGPVEPPPGTPKRYILFVGHRWIYKNFSPFLNAVSGLLRKDRELHLVCAGGDPFSTSENETISKLGVLGQVHHVRIDDNTLVALYKNALAFVFPSLYEGFGLPVLEAFSCGCPVVLSNTSSLPEVGGDAAAYFDPYNEASMTEAVSRVVHDEDARARMAAKGLERSKLFSWDKTAKETKATYLRMAR